jgi:hypothetical protein
MRCCIVRLTAAIFLIVFPGSGLADQGAGIPPMLETQRPLASPSPSPQPPPSPPQQAKPVTRTVIKKQPTKVQGKKAKNSRAASAVRKKTHTPVKKKGATAKPRAKSADHRS